MANKFMLSVHSLVMEKLKREAEERGITIQELLRAVVIPTYFKVKIEISLPEAMPVKPRNDPFMRRQIG